MDPLAFRAGQHGRLIVNGRVQFLSWTTVAAAVVLVSTHGRAFLDALMGLPALVAAWSSQMPFGALSFLLSLGVAAGACAFLLRWLPACRNDASKHFAAETVTVLVAVVVSTVQQRGGTPGDLLTALWLGLLAGFSAPWLVRGIRAAVRGWQGAAADMERRDDAGEG